VPRLARVAGGRHPRVAGRTILAPALAPPRICSPRCRRTRPRAPITSDRDDQRPTRGRGRPGRDTDLARDLGARRFARAGGRDHATHSGRSVPPAMRSTSRSARRSSPSRASPCAVCAWASGRDAHNAHVGLGRRARRKPAGRLGNGEGGVAYTVRATRGRGSRRETRDDVHTSAATRRVPSQPEPCQKRSPHTCSGRRWAVDESEVLELRQRDSRVASALQQGIVDCRGQTSYHCRAIRRTRCRRENGVPAAGCSS